MPVSLIETRPIAGQKPGTSGLRKRTVEFMQPHYLENYVQAIFNAVGVAGKTLVLGGDGRFFNKEACDVILRMAVANKVRKVIVGQNGLLSTPAASHIIRKYQADGGLILSASHNPGGLDGDFGLKFNAANGGPATEALTDQIFAQTLSLQSYAISDAISPNLAQIRTVDFYGLEIEVIDPVVDYADLMEEIFDFPAIRSLIASGFTLRFDAMHAATGPYAREILQNRLGAPEGSVINAVPLPDFGEGHPDPNPIWAKPLVDLVMSDAPVDFAAASDGDGDRNMILGRGIYVSPSDSLAVLAANMHLAPAYQKGIAGIARSMPTSAAADRVAQKRGVPLFETPTGWKFFGTLLDAQKVTICGEESAGTGSDHVREKDGLWAVLLWLNILAATRHSVKELMSAHWAEFGRDFYTRHDYENVDATAAKTVFDTLAAALPRLAQTRWNGLRIESADEFSYDDPVDGSHSAAQGLRLRFEGGARAVLRLSGTGTVGATLRLYVEAPCFDPALQDQDAQDALSPYLTACEEIMGLCRQTGRTGPDVIS